MIAPKKNIWLLFFITMLSSAILLGSISFSRWNDLTNYYQARQLGLAAQWFGMFSSILEQQEAIITLVGEHITLHQNEPEERQALLDSLMNLNPNFFSGFALISPEGKVIELTSNLEQNNVVNLLEAPQTRDSFSYALEADKMVLGRTYFAPRLVIPARKAIRNNQGDVLGVMTGALSLQGTEGDGFFSFASVLGEYNRITIYRNRDHYIQYASNGELINDFHVKPVAEKSYRRLMKALGDNYEGAFPPTSPEVTQISYRWDTHSDRGTVRGVAMYNARYEFLFVSEIEESFLRKEFAGIFAIYLLIMLAFQLSMYFLFRYIDRAEKGRQKALIFQAHHDALTQLPNRNYLLAMFSEWIREKPHFSLLFIDLDNFKGINDNFGHSIGDGILVELTKRLQANINDKELLVRHGGDEFVLLTSGFPQAQNEERVAKLVYEACENIHALHMKFSPVCSIGIARFPEHGTQLDTLLRASDIAMYEAKKKRNSVEIFRPSFEEHYLHQIRIEQMLRGAEERGEIFMTYQPQVDSEGHLKGIEALVRWRQPELGLIPPDQFIGIAERSGRMVKIGEYIIDQSLSQFHTLYQHHNTHIRLSINISIRQVAEENFANHLLSKIQSKGIPLNLICLEITESLLIDDLDHMRNILQKLHSEGIRLALDDFGTGYSSLSILRDLPIDELKIDKSFVDNILKDETALKMVKNIINIGRLYKMEILAEGVETVEQMQLLKECGCDLFQGYLFSKPVAIENLERYFNSI